MLKPGKLQQPQRTRENVGQGESRQAAVAWQPSVLR